MHSTSITRKQQRAKMEQQQRRLRGHHIKRGLGELGDLDVAAPPVKQARVASASSTDKATVPLSKSEDVRGPSPPESSADTTEAARRETPAVALTVFGPDWEEWKEAKRVLFNTEATPAEKRDTLQKLQLWEARVRKARPMPPYVEATVALMDAVLCDESRDTPDQRLLQLYSAALSRVVHIMTGSFANGKADTYRKRAQQIQFPEEAVEVRQRVAHGALPSLSELRWATGLTLQFLFHHYWLVQEQHVRELVREAPLVAAPSRRAEPPATRPPKVKAPSMSVDEIYSMLKELSNDEASGSDDGDAEAETGTQNRRGQTALSSTTVAGWSIL